MAIDLGRWCLLYVSCCITFTVSVYTLRMNSLNSRMAQLNFKVGTLRVSSAICEGDDDIYVTQWVSPFCHGSPLPEPHGSSLLMATIYRDSKPDRTDFA